MSLIRTIVVDDEHSNRELLHKLISENEAFSVIGQADRVSSAIQLINELAPEVVFLDIRMPDGNGFELLNALSEINFFVVFVSAFDNYALKAFDYNAIDYILKPIDYSKFETTLQKIITARNEKLLTRQSLKEIIEQYDIRNLLIQKISLHVGNKVVLVPVNEVISAVANEGTTLFTTINGSKYSSSKQLSDFDFIFESYPPMFRVNKGAYLNSNYVESYSKGSICIVFMQDNSEFEVSRRKKTEILKLLSGIK